MRQNVKRKKGRRGNWEMAEEYVALFLRLFLALLERGLQCSLFSEQKSAGAGAGSHSVSQSSNRFASLSSFTFAAADGQRHCGSRGTARRRRRTQFFLVVVRNQRRRQFNVHSMGPFGGERERKFGEFSVQCGGGGGNHR